MKNFKFILAAAFALAALSCEKVETTTTNPETNPEDGLVTLTLSTGEATKTHLVNGTEIHWDSGDQIEVFSNETRYDGGLSGSWSNNTTFSIDNNSISGNFAKFTGNVPKGTTKIWAVYPAGNASSCETNGTNMKVTLPIEQKAVENTFDNNLNISVAKAEVSNTDSRNEFDPQTTSVPVNFENVCSFLKFTTPGTDNTQSANISKVILSSNTAIAGSLVIDPATPKVTSSSSTSITISGSFKQNTEYWFVIAKSGDVLNGLSLTVVTKSGDVYCWAISDQTTLKTGQYRSIGKISLNENHKITLSAQHTYDDSGYLTGTDVSVKCGTTILTPSTYSIKKGDSEKRNQDTTNYPYLPKGTGYTYKGTVTWNQVNVAVPEMSFVVPEPSIAVSDFTPFTSHTTSKSSGANANTLDGHSVYLPVTIKIKKDFFTHSEYKNLISYNNGSLPTLKDHLSQYCVVEGGKPLGSYTVPSIKWSFDGVTVTAKSTLASVPVSGIPYDYSFDGKSVNDIRNNSGWTLNGNFDTATSLGNLSSLMLFHLYKEKTGGSLLRPTYETYTTTGFVVSPEFYIPEDTKVKTCVVTSGYIQALPSTAIPAVGYVGPVGSQNAKSTEVSFTTTCRLAPVLAGEGTWLQSFTLTSTNKRFSVSCAPIPDEDDESKYFLHKVYLHYSDN